MASMSGCAQYSGLISGDDLCPGSDWQWYEIAGAACMIEWGIIHVIAAILLVPPASRNDPVTFYTRLMDAMPDSLKEKYEAFPAVPPYTMRVMIQHGLNLGWCGILSLATTMFMADSYMNRFAGLLCIVPWFADMCYWISLDVPEVVGPIGQAQTYIVSVGTIFINIGVNERYKKMPGGAAPSDAEFGIMIFLPCLLIGVGIIQRIGGALGKDVWSCLICEATSEASGTVTAQVV